MIDGSPEEQQIRVNLAACYRLVASYGWDDLIFTHISARLPGDQHAHGAWTGSTPAIARRERVPSGVAASRPIMRRS